MTGRYYQLNNGTITVYVDENGGKAGYYWASTYNMEGGSLYAFKIISSRTGGSTTFAGQEVNRATGCAVRLVRDVD